MEPADSQIILKPPEQFQSPVNSWRLFGCNNRRHYHLNNLRATMPCCLLKRCSQDTFYRTWPSRIIKQTIPKKKTIATQSSPGINGNGSTGINRLVWFTGSTESRSFNREIGVSIRF